MSVSSTTITNPEMHAAFHRIGLSAQAATDIMGDQDIDSLDLL